MVKSLSIFTMGVHAGKLLKHIVMEKLQRLSLWPKRQQEYGAIVNGVGENPLNGKSMLLTHNGEDEEIVLTWPKG